ncbi:hypothetical protein HS088_TW06G00529 [Tripterygium wilfordii]|uniref:Potassium transporter n=1 Tax=Tripterygium wilfordii TaxID=458696 RepID=A0A7J7DJ76_TRIWF|nr:hypothetical protein HS088_TW06G00529 [Tripterygium wilfordii]
MSEKGNFEEEGGGEERGTQVQNNLKEKKLSWGKLRRVDSLNLEAGNVSMSASHTSKVRIISTLQVLNNCIIVLFYLIGFRRHAGTEAMFADLGHFNVRAIQLSFSCITLPSLLAAYSGQAAFLSKFPNEVADTFYASIPDPLYWPTFVIAVAAAIIASQAMISGAFAIISQSLTLNCFPRVKVVHTSAKYEGQVYIPEVNYMLMVACVIVCVAFQTTENIGHAYGIAVVAVMVMTTFMITLIMLVIWRTRLSLVVLFFAVFSLVELVYLSSVLYKFKEGGYLPLALAFFLVTIMGIWHYAQRQRYIFELNNKVSSESIKGLISDRNVNRIPGIGLLYSELVQGIPPIFPHFIANVPSAHSVLVFVSIKLIPISKVALEERFLFRQVEPREYRMFRCIVRYGYNDPIEESQEFERQLVENMKEFIRQEHAFRQRVTNDESLIEPENPQHSTISAASASSSDQTAHTSVQGAEDEVQFVQKAMERGVVYLLGEAEVVAEPNSSFFNKMVVNYAYSFLRKNFRDGKKVLAIPRTRLVKVGMTYEI